MACWVFAFALFRYLNYKVFMLFTLNEIFHKEGVGVGGGGGLSRAPSTHLATPLN